MAASPFPSPSAEDVESASRIARDWGTVIIGSVTIALTAIGTVWRVAAAKLRRQQMAIDDRVGAVEHRVGVLETARQTDALKIVALESLAREVQRVSDRVESVSDRVDTGFAGLNERLDRFVDHRGA